MKANIYVTLKNGVLDPQGKAIEGALNNLGFQGVNEVRQGKFIEVKLDNNDPETAKQSLTEMCETLLANTVIEDYQIQLNE